MSKIGNGRPRRLPERFRRFFWSYDFGRLRWSDHRDLIIETLLREGDQDALVWMRTRMTPSELRDWILRRRGRGLDPRRIRFWQKTLKLPPVEVAAWLDEHRRHPWLRRGGG